MNSQLLACILAWVLVVNPVTAASWNELCGKPDAPRLVAFNSSKTHPASLPFVAERKVSSGFWTSFDAPPIIAKIGETAVKSNALTEWRETGMWMHLLVGSDWISLPLYETSGAATGAVKKGEDYFALNAAFWKSLQPTRPPAKTSGTPSSGAKAKTGAFTAKLGTYDGQPMTPDDRKKNPFYKYKGDPAVEEAEVLVPATYNGTEPYGLIVNISPGHDGANSAPGGWRAELAARRMIWIGPKNAGNNQTGDRRVWMAQQARAWALHHYKIDLERMIIAGYSNGADAASATAVATPFGFNGALLFAPPCEPPIGKVHVPKETDHTAAEISPLSSAGISHIKNTWRIVHVVGTKDSFLASVRSSAKAVQGFKMGCKLVEVEGLGHAPTPSIGQHLDFLDAPRATADSQSTAVSFSADSYLADVRRAMAASRASGCTAMSQLWSNHPEVRTNPDVLALLEKMEALP